MIAWRSLFQRASSFLPSSDTLTLAAQSIPAALVAVTQPAEAQPPNRIIDRKFLTRAKVRSKEQIQGEILLASRRHTELDTEFKAKLSILLPIEADVREGLTKHYQPFLDSTSADLRRLQLELELLTVNTQYPLVDMQFLGQLGSYRIHGVALPKYALFDADHAVFSMSGDVYEKNTETAPRKFYVYQSPTTAQEHFDSSTMEGFGGDYLSKNKDANLFTVSVKIAARFPHVLSTEARQILVSKLGVFDEVFFVTEAPNWIITLSGAAVAVNVFSKKVSVIGRNGKSHWLVAETLCR